MIRVSCASQTNRNDSYIVSAMNNLEQANAGWEGDLFREKCRQNNLRITPQRLVVYRELIESKDHPSADAVYRRLRRFSPNISLDTVNRTLLTFQKIGLAHIVAGSGVPKRFDAILSRHHHFRCLACNRIVDIYSESFDSLHIPADIRRQYVVISKTVHLEGYCDKCREKDLSGKSISP